MILLIKLSNERIKLVSLNLNPDSEILLSLLNPHAQILPPLPHPPGRPLVPHHYHFFLFLLSFTLFFFFVCWILVLGTRMHAQYTSALLRFLHFVLHSESCLVNVCLFANYEVVSKILFVFVCMLWLYILSFKNNNFQ